MRRRLYESFRAVERTEWLALGGLALVVFVCFFYRLGGVPLLGKDEPRYAEVAREMAATGDWITPRLAGHTWFEKPALPYWTMAAAYDVFGVSELAARLGAALFALAGVASVYGVARRAGGPRLAVTAAACLATSALWFSFARGAGFDMPLAGTMTVALACVYFVDTARDARGRLVWSAAAGAAAGASMLAKGLAGPLLLGMIVVAYAVCTGAWRRLRVAELAVASLAAALVAATWYVPVIARNGAPFVDDFFVNHHFRRYLTNKYHHPQPIWFYPVIALAGLAPWTFLLFASPRALWRTLRSQPGSSAERLVWLATLWALVPIAFFSLSTSKLPGYIVPSFPGLALLVAWSIERARAEGRGRWTYVATAFVVAALGGGLAWYASTALRAPAWEIVAVAAPLVAVGGLLVAWSRPTDVTRGVWAVAGGGALAVLLLATFMFNEVGHRESLADLSSIAATKLRPDERVLALGVVEYAPAYYTRGRVVVDETGEILIADSYDQLGDAIDTAPTRSVLCVTDARRATELSGLPGFTCERLGEQRDRVLLRVTRRASASSEPAERGPARS